MKHSLIENGRLICPASGLDQTANVYIIGDTIASIGQVPSGFVANETINAKGCVVAPGLIDLSARLREPGDEYRGALASELAAAAKGGITSVVCPPDTDPVLDEPSLIDMLKRRAKSVKASRVLPLGALTVGLQGERLTELGELAAAGCVAFSQRNQPITDTKVLSRCLAYAKSLGQRVWLRPVDAWLGKGGVAASGAVATRLGLSGVPVAAESVFLLTLFELLRANPTPVHLQCISSARGVELLRQAKREGLPVTADVSIYHLHLTDMDIGFFDANMRFEPPLRGRADRAALRSGVIDGTIDAICSDHSPYSTDDKLQPFAEAAAGANGLEFLLSLAVKFGSEEKLNLTQTLKPLTQGASLALGQPAPKLAAGSAADLVIFNPEAHWQPKAGNLISLGKHSPMMPYELPAQVCATVVAGGVVYRA